MNLFEKLGLNREILEVIKKLRFETPTEIQELSIPHIIKGEDVIGESATGSGKTLAFAAGVIEQVVAKKGLQALILTPTRELAEQVKEEIKKLSFHKHLNVISIYGGVAIGPQVSELARADVVVATPGRLLDHLRRGTVNISKIKLLVLDEADRMFDMGFIDDVEKIIRGCPKDRQTLFFSATISPEIKKLAKRHMKNQVEVSAVNQVDPEKLKQVYYDVPNNMKISLLIHLLENEKSGLVMVFCNTRKLTDFVYKNLRANKINATAIHGGLSQNKRSRTIGLFNKAKVNVLVCTDVAARGLHIDDVSHIYNYDIPKDSKDYVHRIGRTARAGEEGKVINLLSDRDHDNFSRVQRDYREFDVERVERPYLKMIQATGVEMLRRREFGHGRGPHRNGGRPMRHGPQRGGRRPMQHSGRPPMRYGQRHRHR